MRLWTIHPRYLDAKGLVAAWREGLLAQKVLLGETRGYTRHPQLTRFQAQPRPVEVVAAYLLVLATEATRRGYSFDIARISTPCFAGRLFETRGQLLFEWDHLKRKLRSRHPASYREFRTLVCPEPHPLFRIVRGGVRAWEKQKAVSGARPRSAKGG